MLGPVSLMIFACTSYWIETLPCRNTVASHPIAANVCTCYDSTAVISYTNFCRDNTVNRGTCKIKISIRFVLENSLLKWDLGWTSNHITGNLQWFASGLFGREGVKTVFWLADRSLHRTVGAIQWIVSEGFKEFRFRTAIWRAGWSLSSHYGLFLGDSGNQG